MTIKELYKEIESKIQEADEYITYWNNITKEEMTKHNISDQDISDNIQWWESRIDVLEDVRMKIEDCEEYNED